MDGPQGEEMVREIEKAGAANTRSGTPLPPEFLL